MDNEDVVRQAVEGMSWDEIQAFTFMEIPNDPDFKTLREAAALLAPKEKAPPRVRVMSSVGFEDAPGATAAYARVQGQVFDKQIQGMQEAIVGKPAPPLVIPRKPVVSSNLRSIGYDAERELLDVEFTSGAIYRFFDVSAEIAERLSGASSPGSEFARSVRGRFQGILLTPEPELPADESPASAAHST